jgi:hypothetical protein
MEVQCEAALLEELIFPGTKFNKEGKILAGICA